MNETDVLALTLRTEADSRPVRAIEAVAALVVNRARLAAGDPAARLRFAPGAGPALTWTQLLGRVCRAPFLFGCWGLHDPRRAALLAPGAVRSDTLFAVCERIAMRAVAGVLPDPTDGATHWHAEEDLPGWAIGQVPQAEIGGLVFYRLAA